jgi:hypothetical protein
VSTSEKEPLDLAWTMHAALLKRSAHIEGFLLNRTSPLFTQFTSPDILEQTIQEGCIALNSSLESDNPNALTQDDQKELSIWIQSRLDFNQHDRSHPLFTQTHVPYYPLPQIPPHQDALQTLHILSNSLPTHNLSLYSS